MTAKYSAVITFLVFTSTICYGALLRHKRSCATMRECLKPFPMLVDLVETDNARALFTLTYDVLLDSVCSKKAELANCMGRQSCSMFEASYSAYAVKDTLQYLCGDGRDALLSEASCFHRDDFVWGIMQCSTEMTLATDIAAVKISTNLSNSTEFCTVFEKYLMCIHRTVLVTCTSRAADFTSAVFGHVIHSLGTQLGCTITFDQITV